MNRRKLVFKTIKGYISNIKKFIILSAIWYVFIYAYFYMCEIDTKLLRYSTLIMLFVGIIAALIDFSVYYRKSAYIITQTDCICDGIAELPEVYCDNDKMYQELINSLVSQKKAMESKNELAENEMVEYYTMWVHQIKTPISAMRLILQTKEKEEKAASNSDLESELFKIEQYVDMVITYLRADNRDSTDYLFEKNDLDQLVRQVIRKYAKIFIYKRVTLTFDETSLTVLTDKKWFMFVIEQVLSNALKYTKDSIHIYSDESTLIIEDNGIGIASEDLPRVFERGYTGYNGRLNNKSTGIGLYLCNKICKNLGHDISIESTAGRGTSVKISIGSIE